MSLGQHGKVGILCQVRVIAAGNAGSTQITQNNSNVSAPVSIQVHASGADPERVGQSLYSMTERYLQRTLESAFS